MWMPNQNVVTICKRKDQIKEVKIEMDVTRSLVTAITIWKLHMQVQGNAIITLIEQNTRESLSIYLVFLSTIVI